MHTEEKLTAETFPASPEKATLEGKNKFIGFWLFLGGETVLFASLFATYLALKNSNAGGPKTTEMFDMGLVFLATMLLLTSSLTSVYAMYHMKNFAFKKMQVWLGITVLLGAGFLALEIYEFTHYIHEYGFTIQKLGSRLRFLYACRHTRSTRYLRASLDSFFDDQKCGPRIKPLQRAEVFCRKPLLAFYRRCLGVYLYRCILDGDGGIKMVNNENRGNPKTDLAYRKKKNAEDMRYQVISFGLMIGLTIVAFLTVASDAGVWFTVPFILLLAVIQVAFQLYYFMHMSQRGHEAPTLFLYSGVLVAFVTVLAFVTLIWW